MVVASLTRKDIVFIVTTIAAMPEGHVKHIWGKLEHNGMIIHNMHQLLGLFSSHRGLFHQLVNVLVWPDQVLRISFTALLSTSNFLP